MVVPSAVVQTHVSTLFFVGDRVYKLKKPRDLGFLDFRTLAARRRACRDEVALNRRLAPDVYLGVSDVLGPGGAACESLVVMRRMPAERRLSRLVEQGADVEDDVRRLARLVARMHAAEGPAPPRLCGNATPDGLRRLWCDGLDTFARYPHGGVDSDLVARTRLLAERYLEGRRPLVERRLHDGLVRDGHGDLLADDVFCLPDGPRALDCLEFDPTLRVGDVLADVAFLAMDLERLGASALGRLFVATWAEYLGESHPASLEHHYVAYRAHVRAKVGAIRAGQTGSPQDAAAAHGLARLALRHLEEGRVVLVLVGGLPGSGKTTVAGALADPRGWVLRSSDVVRKSLAGLPAHVPAGSDYGTGLYTSDMTERTYSALLAQARTDLAYGESVVLDATWADGRKRESARAVAAATHADLVELRCAAPDEVALARMRTRAAARDAGSGSDATAQVRARMAERFAPWPQARVVDTGGTVAAAIGAARAAVDVTLSA